MTRTLASGVTPPALTWTMSPPAKPDDGDTVTIASVTIASAPAGVAVMTNDATSPTTAESTAAAFIGPPNKAPTPYYSPLPPLATGCGYFQPGLVGMPMTPSGFLPGT